MEALELDPASEDISFIAGFYAMHYYLKKESLSLHALIFYDTCSEATGLEQQHNP